MLISQFQTPQAISDVGHSQLKRWLRHRKVRNADKAAAAAAQAAAAQRTRIARLAANVIELDRQLATVDKLIAKRFRTHRQADIITSMVGIGNLLGAVPRRHRRQHHRLHLTEPLGRLLRIGDVGTILCEWRDATVRLVHDGATNGRAQIRLYGMQRKIRRSCSRRSDAMSWAGAWMTYDRYAESSALLVCMVIRSAHDHACRPSARLLREGALSSCGAAPYRFAGVRGRCYGRHRLRSM